MTTSPMNSAPIPHSDPDWAELRTLLYPITRRHIYAFGISSWRGQENDVVEDVIQETLLRLLERSEKARRGVTSPIYSPKHMAISTAYNYSVDMTRRDRRHVRIAAQDISEKSGEGMTELVDYTEIATENVYRETIFTWAVYEIANFPVKQRDALLVDLASRMSFDAQPTPLQKAFLAVGIQLRHYQKPLPTDPEECTRYRSLLHHAYKRLAQLGSMQKNIMAS